MLHILSIFNILHKISITNQKQHDLIHCISILEMLPCIIKHEKERLRPLFFV